MSDEFMREERMIDKQDRLDRLIDRALASYGTGEARPGLEQRILAAVAAEGRSAERATGRAWRALLEGRFARLAIAAALLLAVAAVPVRLMMHHRDATVARLPSGAEADRSLRTGPVVSAAAAGTALAARSRRAAAVVGPQQLTATRKARLDRRQPADESMAFAPIEFQPITIAPIRIRALNQALSRDLN